MRCKGNIIFYSCQIFCVFFAKNVLIYEQNKVSSELTPYLYIGKRRLMTLLIHLGENLNQRYELDGFPPNCWMNSR